MQECILGSLCFLVFLSSFSTAQNSEDLKTGLVEEDEVKSNEEHRYYENEDDSWERSPFRPHPGLYSENYGSILGESNPYSSFGSYSPVYGLGPSYSDADALSHTQTFPGFGSSYASAEASANADALAQLNLYGSPYGSGYFGTGSGLIYPGGASNTNGPTLNLVQAQSDAQVANSGLSYSYPLSDTDLFSTGHSSSLMSSGTNAYNQGIGSGLGSGDHLALNQFSTGLSSASQPKSSAQATASSSGSASSYASANSGVQAQSLIGLGSSSVNAQSKSKSQAFSSGGTAISIASARDFEGVQSRTIPRDEYIIIPGADDIIICTNAGELHNVWSAGYDCLICACVLQNGYLSPVCVTCDLCAIPIQISPLPPLIPPHPSGPNFPQVPPIIPSSTPGPTLDTEVSCDPLPTNTPFQNPLNHCQICICQYSFGPNPDVRITCEDIPTCDVPPSDSIIIPPIPEPPAPVPLPTCEKFPPNVVFPHPFDICQSCECVVIADVPQLEHNIVCYPTPGCEPLLPSLPSTTITTTTTPVPPTELLPWPPLPSLPPGPLPGPLPHKSCAPYPPNQQFQHPWDDCQICVCSEIYSTGVVNIEVNCFTNPVCCRDYPVLRPYTNLIAEGFELQETLATPGSLTVPTRLPPYVATRPSTSLNPVLPQVPNSNSPQHFVSPALPQLKHLDVMCKSREIGIDFLYDRCRICSCEVFGNLVLPVCRRSNLPECTVMSAPVPVGNIVYIEPRCRSRPPWQTFMAGCHSCICHSVFSYVVAKCKPVPGCDKGQSPQSEANKAEAFANSQIGSYNQAYGFSGSQSLAKANAAASFGSSGISGHEGYPPKALTDTQMGSLGYPYGFQSSQSLAEANAATFSGSMVSADSQAGTSFSYPYGVGNEQYSQFLAQTNAAASSGLSKLPKPEIYPIRDIDGTQTGSYNYPYGFEISQNLADANAAAFSEAGGSGIGGYQFAPGSSGYSYADAEALANAYSGSSVYGVLPYKYYPYSGLGQTGSHSQAAAEAEVVSTLYQRPHGQPVPLYKPGIFQQAGNLVQSIADTSANALGLSHGSGYYSRPQIKTGEEELVE